MTKVRRELILRTTSSMKKVMEHAEPAHSIFPFSPGFPGRMMMMIDQGGSTRGDIQGVLSPWISSATLSESDMRGKSILSSLISPVSGPALPIPRRHHSVFSKLIMYFIMPFASGANAPPGFVMTEVEWDQRSDISPFVYLTACPALSPM